MPDFTQAEAQLAVFVADVLASKLRQRLLYHWSEVSIQTGWDKTQAYVTCKGLSFDAADFTVLDVAVTPHAIQISYPQGSGLPGVATIPLDVPAAVQLALGGVPAIDVPADTIVQIAAGIDAWVRAAIDAATGYEA